MIQKIKKFFNFEARGASISKELIGGISMFLAGAYILAVNPGILSSAGLDAGAVFTATALSAAIATILMAFIANVPIFLASGMGLNAFFSYSVVLGMGISPATALTAVLVEGIIFIFLTIFNVRQYIVESIPNSLRKAIPVGIGLFICAIGCINSGIIISNPATVVGLGAVKSGSALLALIGLAITGILMVKKVPGSILLSILITTIIGIPLGVTIIPENFSLVSLPPIPQLFNFSFDEIFTFNFLIIMFVFLFTDIFDTLGTVIGCLSSANMLDENGSHPKMKQIFLADAVGTVTGAVLGTSTVTSYVESGASFSAGAKTGLAALVTGTLFLLALIFSPIFLLIPSAATAPALIIVGLLMFKGVKDIDFTKDLSEAIPAFIAIFMMPLAYSISEGIFYSVLSFVIIKLMSGKFKEISIPTYILFGLFALRLIFLL
jgi:AGZA family xanthine/uracil permease-like MFS transporter